MYRIFDDLAALTAISTEAAELGLTSDKNTDVTQNGKETIYYAPVYLTGGQDVYEAQSSDTVYALGGNDGLSVADDSDDIIIFGGDGRDTLTISWTEDGQFYGQDGNDVFNVDIALLRNSIFDGGAGNDEFNVELNDFNVPGNSFAGGDGVDHLNFTLGNNFKGLIMLTDYYGSPDGYGGTFDITNNVYSGNYDPITATGFESLTMVGGGYADIIRGASGEDDLTDGVAWSGTEPEGATYSNYHSDDELYGMGGNDTLTAMGGDDLLDGGAGNDVLTSGANYTSTIDDPDFGVTTTQEISNSTLIGGSGNDTLNSNGEDLLWGGAGNDALNNPQGNATAVYSSADVNDYIVLDLGGGRFSVEAVGGTSEGTDILDGIMTIRLGGLNGTDYNTASLVGDGITTLTEDNDVHTEYRQDQTVYALGGDDQINVNASNVIVFGGDGDDILRGGANSVLYGEGGNDSLQLYGDGTQGFGGAGNDTFIIGDGASLAVGGDGDDTMTVHLNDPADGYDDSFTLIGGDGIDVLDLRTSYLDMSVWSYNYFGGTINLQTNEATGDYDALNFDGFERLQMTGGGDGDNITGGNGADEIIDGGFYVFFGGAGGTFPGNGNNDSLYGMGGDDTLTGTGGIDIIDGGDGNDVLTSGADYEGYIYDGGEPEPVIRPAEATMIGGAGDDTINSHGEDLLYGGSGNDTLNNNEDLATAVYDSADVNDYSITSLGNGVYTIEAVGGTGEGFDTLDGVDTIRLGGMGGTDFAIASLVNNNTIDLTNGDDVFTLNQDNVILNALDGNDQITSNATGSTINGGNGDDSIISLGNDVVNGDAGNDVIDIGGGVFDDTTAVDGGAGIDTFSLESFNPASVANASFAINLDQGAFSLRENGSVTFVEFFSNFENATGSNVDDLLQGTDGTNVLRGLGGDDRLQGRDGRDFLYGGEGDNWLEGGDGNDVIYSFGNDIIDGGNGNDLVILDLSVLDNTTFIDGGAGIDTINISRFDASTASNPTFAINLEQQAFSLRENGSVVFVEFFSGFENATGSSVTDLLQGTDDVNTLQGLGGDDTLQGRGGDDILFGGDGDDALNGGAGADQLFGGSGNDAADYSGSDSRVYIDLLGLVTATNDAAGDQLISIENLIGTDFRDRLYGDNDANGLWGGDGIDALFGRSGNDALYGGGDFDYLYGGRGDDSIWGGDGDDLIYGEDGTDTLYGEAGNDIMLGGEGADFMDGGAGADRVQYHYRYVLDGVTASLEDSSINTGIAAGDVYVSIENLYGTISDDILYGDSGANRLSAMDGDDALYGGAGMDSIYGGGGDDVLNGGADRDTLVSGTGADIMEFDAGHGNDRIIDFTQGQDLISYLDASVDFNDLTITQDGAHVLISSMLGTIQVFNSVVADFTADDFMFAASAEPVQDKLVMVMEGMDAAVTDDAQGDVQAEMAALYYDDASWGDAA